MLHIYSYLATTFKSLAAEINKIIYLLGNLAEPYIIALVEKSCILLSYLENISYFRACSFSHLLEKSSWNLTCLYFRHLPVAKL